MEAALQSAIKNKDISTIKKLCPDTCTISTLLGQYADPEFIYSILQDDIELDAYNVYMGAFLSRDASKIRSIPRIIGSPPKHFLPSMADIKVDSWSRTILEELCVYIDRI